MIHAIFCKLFNAARARLSVRSSHQIDPCTSGGVHIKVDGRLHAPIDLQGVGPRVAQDALAAIGPRTDLGVPANTGRSCPRSTRQAEGVRYSAARPSHWLDETFSLLLPRSR
jgi:hypothetical protein